MIANGIHINEVGGAYPGKTYVHKDILRRSQMFLGYKPHSIELDLLADPADSRDLFGMVLRDDGKAAA